MTDSHNSTISAMLEDLQGQLRLCSDVEERNSLRLAIKHLRTTQDLLNPGSNLRRSRRKMLKKKGDNFANVLDNKTLDQSQTSETGDFSMRDCCPTESLSTDVFSVHSGGATSTRKFTDDGAGVKTTRDSWTREDKDGRPTESSTPISPLKSEPDEVFDSSEHSVRPEGSCETSRRESRTRSSFPHLLKLRGIRGSKEAAETKSPSPVTSPDEKSHSFGKRKLSKRFLRRASKSFTGENSDSSHKPPTSEIDVNLGSNFVQQADLGYSKISDSSSRLEHPDHLPVNSLEPIEGYFHQSSSPNQCDTPELTSPKKEKSTEQHAQRRRSVTVIRRAIDRLFTPKTKHLTPTESSGKKSASSAAARQKASTASVLDTHSKSLTQVQVSSALPQSESHLHNPNLEVISSTPLSSPLSKQSLETVEKMAEVIYPPQDVALVQLDVNHDKTDHVIVEETADITPERQPVLEIEIEEKEDENKQQQLADGLLSEPVCEEDSSLHTKESFAAEEKSLFVNNSSLNTSQNSSSSPPWAANQLKKSSFKSVQFGTPANRPTRPKDFNSAPAAYNKAVADSDLHSPQSSSVSCESTPSSRFGKREHSASFKAFRPSYKLPDHVVSRAASFRLHRPKDFIKPSSAEEPARSPSSDRIVSNPVTPSGNQTPVSFSSTPLNSKSSLSHPDSTSDSKSTSLLRSESCKENRIDTSHEPSLPFIPIARGSKRRSRGILSRILSSKIDSEKAKQSNFSPLTFNKSFENEVFSATKQLQSVSEKKAPSDTVSVGITEEDSVVPEPLSNLSKSSPAEDPAPENLSEVLEVAKDSLQPTLEVQQNQAESKPFTSQTKTFEVDADQHTNTNGLSPDVIKFISNLVSQVVSSIKEENCNTSSVPTKQETLENLSESCPIDSDTLPPSSPVLSLDLYNTKLSSVSTEIQQVEVIVEDSIKTAEAKAEANLPVQPKDISETSLEDKACFPVQSDSSLSIDSVDSDGYTEDVEKMEGKYSVKSRRVEGTGSVKSKIQATEGRNETALKATESKRGRHGIDSRAFRNAEGVKSRMNKFASIIASSSPTKSSSKKEVYKHSDANNNVNGGIIKSKVTVKAGRKIQLKTSNSGLAKEIQENTAVNVTSNGHVNDPVSIKVVENGKISEGNPKSDIDDQSFLPSRAIVKVEFSVEHNNSGGNSSAPPVIAVKCSSSPQNGSNKELTIDEKISKQQILSQVVVADVADDVMNAKDEVFPSTTLPAENGQSQEAGHPPISKQPDAVLRDEVTEEKSAPKPARRGRRRSSKSAENQVLKTLPLTETATESTSQTANQDQSNTVEVTSRRRRRVRKSSDATKTSSSVSPATTPEREIRPLVPVKISDVESIPSPKTPIAMSVSSPVSPQSSVKIGTKDSQAALVVVTSPDVIEKKRESEDERIKVMRVHSAPTDETVLKQTKETNKEQNTNAIIEHTHIEQIRENTTEIKTEDTVADTKQKMAPQTTAEIRYTINNIDDCDDEATLQKMMSEAVLYEDRKRIRSAIRNLKKKQANSINKSEEIFPTKLCYISPTNGEGNFIAQTKSQESRMTRNHQEVRIVNDKYSLHSTATTFDMSSSNKKVGSIFDREDEDLRKPAPRSTQVDKRRELVRNRSMPASSAKDARKLFVARLEGESGGKTGKKIGRSPTFVVPNANNVKQMLLKWCQSKTRGYEQVDINNFSGSWANGMAFCALVHNFFPDAFDFSTLDPKNRAYNFELAFTTAQRLANADPLLDVEDMMIMGNRPDSKCVFTYVQSLYNKLRKFEKPLKPLTPTETKPEAEKS